ncbi:MAG: 4'-phosphopantetheinyl transferase superfamily protein [Chitinispirillaceae bacterium]|nr:4'-phosphopantetheinyl transferase superfamily protein [Chitinispirillaceae bacterium]
MPRSNSNRSGIDMADADTTDEKCESPQNLTVRIFALPDVTTMREEEYLLLLDFVTDECRQRAARFIRHEDRYRCVAGEVLARYAVSRFSGQRDASWRTGKNKFGKPYLLESPVHFNVSHSGKWVLCAVDHTEIGVDVEVRRRTDPAVAERFFSTPERHMLAAVNVPEETRSLFFRLWVLKESYIKAIGRGLDCPLDSFACLPDGTDGAAGLVRFDDTLPEAAVRWFTLDKEHCGAVCCFHAVEGVEIITVPADDLSAFVTGKP